MNFAHFRDNFNVIVLIFQAFEARIIEKMVITHEEPDDNELFHHVLEVRHRNSSTHEAISCF